jgi:hypothetical protein
MLNPFPRPALFVAGLLMACGLHADVTIRYQAEFTPAPALRPLLEQFMKTALSGMETSVSVKGGKAFTSAGKFTEIFDFTQQQVTLLDPTHKTFAVLPASQLADRMASAMPQANSKQMEAAQKALESIHTSVDSKVTGHSEEIHGVQSEERVVTLTMDMPVPGGAGPSGLVMKMVMHIWTAKKEEALRVPAIRELTGYREWQKYFMDPASVFDKLLGKMPGAGKTIGPLLGEMFKGQSVVMRTHMEIYLPMLAGLARNMAAQGKDAPAMDPDAPLIVMKQEVAELSSAPVDASLFEVPKEYTSLAADDMIRDLLANRNAPPAAAPANP